MRPPFFDIDTGYLIVTFLGTELTWSNIRISNDFLEELNDILKKIVQKLLEKNKISTNDISEMLSINPRTARKHIAKLRELGIIEARGKGKNTYYVLRGK